MSLELTFSYCLRGKSRDRRLKIHNMWVARGSPQPLLSNSMPSPLELGFCVSANKFLGKTAINSPVAQNTQQKLLACYHKIYLSTNNTS